MSSAKSHQALLEELAGGYNSGRKQMLKEREKLQAQLQKATRQVELGKAAERPDVIRYFSYAQHALQAGLQQLDALDVADDVLSFPNNGALATVQLLSLEADLWRLAMDDMTYQRLEAILAQDLAPALAGEPAARRQPAAWEAIRPTLVSQPEWREALSRFRMERPEFHEWVAIAVVELERLQGLPVGPERLAAVKELNVPAMAGVQYRIEALFRAVPGGEALIAGVKVRPLAGEPKPEAPARRMTDRLRKIFKVDG